MAGRILEIGDDVAKVTSTIRSPSVHRSSKWKSSTSCDTGKLPMTPPFFSPIRAFLCRVSIAHRHRRAPRWKKLARHLCTPRSRPQYLLVNGPQGQGAIFVDELADSRGATVISAPTALAGGTRRNRGAVAERVRPTCPLASPRCTSRSARCATRDLKSS